MTVIKRLLLSVLAGIAVLTVVLFLLVRASLPQLSGDLRVQGLHSRVTIERDAAGIPTITGSDREDLAFATGFAHGQDRFFQMDLIRRQAAGELAEIFGEVALETDKRNRFHRFRQRALVVLEQSSAADLAILESYTAGVNAGVDSLVLRPFEYLMLRVSPEAWQVEDSILVAYAMFMQLNDARARRDVRRGFAHNVLPGEVYDWLYPEGTPWDAPLMGEPRAVAPIPSADQFSIRDVVDTAAPTQERGKIPLNGSNNWAVSGALTETGRAMVSNDMHLGLSTPNIYYQARLVVTDGRRIDLSGVTLPGTPFVVAGSNGNIAWGYTNSYGDWSDAVVVRPGSAPGTYRTADGDRPFDVYREVIDIKGGSSQVLEIRETVWGPVDDVDYPHGEIAVSWIAHKPEAVNLRLIALETVENVTAALDVANTIGMPPQNFVTGDSDGNIGWTIAGRIPVKTEFNAMVPADWSQVHGWTGWLDPADYPRIVNPGSGRIWTANARVADGDALSTIGDGGYDLGARARQIRDSLAEKDSFDARDMLRIQLDDRALFLAPWQELLLAVLDDDTIAGDAELIEFRRLVDEWIPRAATDSAGYRLVRAFRLEVRSVVFHGLMGPVRDAYGDDVKPLLSNQFEAPLWSLVTERPMHMLPARYASWHALLVAAVRANIAWLDHNYKGPLAERTWGELNVALIRHPLSRAVPALSKWLDMAHEPLSGDHDMPKAQGPGFGASERFSVSPGDEANGLMQMPTGQSGHPLSDFYRQGHDDWVHGRPSPYLPGETLHTLTLTPAS